MSEEDLFEFVEALSGESRFAVEENLGDGFVRLKTAEAERRQAKHDIRCVEDVVIEMLRNARDANAHSIYLATSRDGSIKTLTFLDDGDGIPADMHERVFEPRVTSKLDSMVMDTWGVHGRGMALYSIRSNARDASVVASAPRLGSALSVVIDLETLPEKTDQSSMPVLEREKDGSYHVASGPHNVNRTVVEFAIDCLGKLDVYLGSPAEIAATLVHNGTIQLDDSQRLFCDDPSGVPYVLRPSLASDAIELARFCGELGLEMSDRTAHRILSGSIEPCEPILNELISRGKGTRAPKEVDIFKDRRGLKIAADDLASFSRALEQAFSEISQKYYIELTEEPIIRVSKDRITVKYPFDKEL